MTLDELEAYLQNECDNIEKQIDENNKKIKIKEQECLDDYQNINKSQPVTSTETAVHKGNNGSYKLKDPSGNTIKPQKKYEDGTTLEYNNVTYEYSDEYGAFVNKGEPLCTTDNISKYLIPKSTLKELNANVITEFQPNVKNEDKQIKEKNYFSTPYNNSPYLKTSNNGELPISRIYNVDHDVDKIYFEVNQTWGGSRKGIKETKISEATNGCFAFSLINGCPYDTKESYNSQETCDSINHTVSNVLDIFYRKDNNLMITSSNRYSEIAEASHIATALDKSITTKDGLKNIDQTKSYIIHTDNKNFGNEGKIGSSGTHFVMMIPSGIDDKCYVIDSNNSAIKTNNKFTPFMAYDEAIPSIVSGKNSIVDIAIPINYKTNVISSTSYSEGG